MGLNRELFAVFFKTGIGTIGGGYAMVPMMQREIVERRGWLTEAEFLDILAVAQTTPGVFAVNMSSHIGQRLGGLLSAIVASVANILPSLIIILALAIGAHYLSGIEWVEYAFRGIRPVVVALIAAPALSMARSAGLSWRTIWIPLLAIGLIVGLKVSTVYVILGAGAWGLMRGLFNKARA